MTRSVVILTPSYSGQCDIAQRELFLALGLRAAARGVLFTGSATRMSPSVDWSRNRLMVRALSSGADYALWIDDDSWGPPSAADLVFDMIDAAEDYALLAGNLPNRHDGGGTVLSERGLVEHEAAGQGPLPALRAGLGLAVANLAWFKARWPGDEPWFQSQQTIQDGVPVFHGEDYRHCDRIRELGGEVGYMQAPQMRNGR